MSSSIQVYEPVAPCLTQPQKSRQSLDKLAGKTIGFIDNSKPNFNLLVEDLSQLLIEKHGVKAVVKQRKRSASICQASITKSTPWAVRHTVKQTQGGSDAASNLHMQHLNCRRNQYYAENAVV